jgi:putative membrane protein
MALPTAPAMLDDRLFAMAAGAGGLAELVSSQAALARSRDEEVRKFAQQMVTDHTQAHQQLTQVVANKGIGLPLTLDLKDQAAFGALSVLQPEAYDREYARYQVAAHLGMVQLFQAEAQNGRDPEIKGFAAQNLPKLQHHLQMARQLMGRRDGGERQRGEGGDQGDVRRPEAAPAAPPAPAAPAAPAAPPEQPGQAAEAKGASRPEP